MRGSCAQKPANFFVDSGSSVSIVGESFVRSIGKFEEIQPCKLKLTSFSGNNIRTYGQIKLPVLLAGKSFEHTFIVSEFHEAQILVGMDMMFDQGININSRDRALYTEQGSVSFRSPPKPVKHCMKIVCNETVVIPPLSGTHIAGKLIRPRDQGGDIYGQIEPYFNTMIGTGIFTAQAMVNSRENLVPVRVMNPSDKPITLHKRTWLGKLKPLDLGERVMRVTAETVETGDGLGHQITSDSTAEEEPVRTEWDKESLFKELKLNDLNISESEKDELRELCWNYKSIFSTNEHDLGCCNFYEAHLELKENYKPRWVPSRPIPYKYRSEMDRQIRGLLRSGVIEECTEHSNFNSCVFLVPSKSKAPRLVADLRLVNMELKDDLMELPNINHILDKVGDRNLYSTLDLSKSFHQVPYSRESRPITQFLYNGRPYQFARMVMGLKNSSSSFTRMIMTLISGLGVCDSLAYFIDDLIVFTRDVKSHIQVLGLLFHRLQLGNLKLTPRKCHFLREEVEYVGITLTKDGVKMNDSRIQHIKDLKPPTNKAELQSVLGMLNYSKKFCRRYSEIARPLYALLRKKSHFAWSQECEDSFQKLKESLITSPVLAFPDVEDPHNSYELTLDGSKFAFGAHLSQMIKGKRRIIAYFSRKIPEHKTVWSQTQLEFETLYQALKHFEIYLRGAKTFRVITDCLPLLSITKIFSKTSSAVIRKLQYLACFKFTIHHISGKANSLADGLSRYSYQQYGRKAANKEKESVNCNSSGFEHSSAVEAVNKLTIEHYSRNHPELIEASPETECEPSQSVLASEDSSDRSLIPDFLFDESSTEEDSTESKTESTVVKKENSVEEHVCFCHLELAPDVTKNSTSDESVAEETEQVRAVQTNSIPSNTRRPITHDVIKKAQKGDNILKQVYDWVIKKEKPKAIQANRVPSELLSYWKQFELLSVKRGLLRRRWVDTKNSENDRELVIIPLSLQETVLKIVHEQESGHAGVANSLELCRRHFYWPGMSECFKLWVAACYKCAASKPPQAYSKAPLQHILFHEFNAGIVIDHIEPEKVGTTPRGYKYILTMTDCWSNYLVAVPTKSQRAEESISLIRRYWIDRFGMPKEMMSDNHPSFRSKYFETVLDAFECKSTHGQSWVKRTCGRVERANRRINTALRTSLPEGRHKDWDLWLSRIIFVLNSLRNRHTGYSSNKLVFGRDLNTPLSLVSDNSAPLGIEPMKENEYDAKAYQLYKDLKHITKRVHVQAERDFCYAQKYHDKNIKGPFFEQGEEAFVLINCPKHKFGPRWAGPYKISRKINDHLYCLDLPNDEKRIFNIGKLKRYVRNRYSPKQQQIVKPVVDNSPNINDSDKTRRHVHQESESESDSDSDDEVLMRFEKPHVVHNKGHAEGKLREVPHLNTPLSLSTGPTQMNIGQEASQSCSTPKSSKSRSSTCEELQSSPLSNNSSPAPSDQSTNNSSAAFYTPATNRTAGRTSQESPYNSDNTILPEASSPNHSSASLSPVNFDNCSPPERRYNTRSADQRRKPDRLGYEQVNELTVISEMLQFLQSRR